MMRRCDLHIHSKYSDGALSPSEIMRRLKESGIYIASITDHDTVSGLEEAKCAAIKYGITFIDGIEISSYKKGFGEIHILGYGINVDDEAFKSELVKIKNLRKERIAKIFDKLKDNGIEFDEEKKKSVRGRVDVAYMLKNAKYVETVNEAFDKWLGKNGKAYVDAVRADTLDAVRIIKSAGGVPVFAHPLRTCDADELNAILPELTHAGLMGLEVYYPSHNDDMRRIITEYATRYNLVKTGGSDFHTDASAVKLGDGDGVLDEDALQIILKK